MKIDRSNAHKLLQGMGKLKSFLTELENAVNPFEDADRISKFLRDSRFNLLHAEDELRQKLSVKDQPS